ncbi:WD repeat domain-containing protein 83-like [Pecten maximus]|uniref:WD repeat domain-containing protein 83-like n=1 Tax=Pecten maximus TaxID=6579 RepID=UPI001458098A|nr:WD repeat domain-containing protein 83-like [Pecten maximus]
MNMGEEFPEKLISTVNCKQGAVRAVRFNVGGDYCLTCGSDKSVRLWNPHRGIALKTYTGHGYEVLDAQSSSDNSQICSGGMDKTVMLFDVATGKAVRKYRGHAGTVNCVKFNEESTLILSGSIDSTVRIWDCRTKKMEPIQKFLDFPHKNPNKKKFVLIRFFPRVRGGLTGFWGKGGEMMLNEYKGHKNNNYRLDSCLNVQDTHVLSGSEDGSVYIWGLVEAKILKKLAHGSDKAIHSLAFHPEDTCLLTASMDKMYVWKSKYAPSRD